MGRGFAFQQLAVILLVVLALVVFVVAFITQSGKVTQDVSKVGEAANTSVINPCTVGLGTCKQSCGEGETEVNLGCPDGRVCCKPS